MKTKEYLRGYVAAKEVLEEGDQVQRMFNNSYNALDQTDFDKGWRAYCLENGARDEN